MKKIIVTVTDNKHFKYELELPAEVVLLDMYGELAYTINKANEAHKIVCPTIRKYELYSKRNKSYLNMGETFQQAKVYTGDTIVIQAE